MTENNDKYKKITIKIVSQRILPFLFILYVFTYLSRVNVSFASLEMNNSLGFSSEVYGFASGIFFIGYFFLQIPSNLIIERIGARRWLSPIIMTCGFLVICIAFVKNAQSFYVLRFLLGAVQAGFFPGMILYLTYWFPPEYHAEAVAVFMTASPISSVIGGPLSGLLLKLNGFLCFEGWQWVFIIEGIPLMILGVMMFIFLTDHPDQAKWLNEEQKKILTENSVRNKNTGPNTDMDSRGELTALRKFDVWALALFYFSFVVCSYGLSLWMPAIIKKLFHLSNPVTSALSALPFMLAAASMVVAAKWSDKISKRTPFLIVMMFVGSAFLAGAAFVSHPTFKFINLCLATLFIYGVSGPFWALPSQFLDKKMSGAGIAIINSVGNLGGFAGTNLMGSLYVTYGFKGGLAALALSAFIAATIAVFLKSSQA